MKKLFIIICSVAAYMLIMNVTVSCKKENNSNPINDTLPAMSGKLFVNEVFSKSISGTVNDWVELYNSSDSTLMLDASFTLTDSIPYPSKFLVTKTYYIKPKSYFVIECDGDDTCTDAIHTSFKLSSSGEQFAIFGSAGVIDQVTFPDMSTGDVSYARTTNGGPNWNVTNTPTKGLSNN